ncbi:MAG: outer membrane beta-barrel protein [Acidobacteriota bacterium]|nr:outer membrane beta-barrel protein [Acidobacteriota bacterium]
MSMTSARPLLLAAILIGLLGLTAAPAAAADGAFDLGVRGNVLVGNGEPTNDMLGYGIFARFRVSDGWRVGVGVDHTPEFDVEGVAGLVGQSQDPAVDTVDAKASSTVVQAWLERSYPSGRIEWFWTVGAGVGNLEVDKVSGPRAGGGTFTVETDAGTEFIAAGSLGLRWFFTRMVALEVAGRLDYHFADWTLVERVSGATSTVDDYLVTGGHVGFTFRF